MANSSVQSVQATHIGSLLRPPHLLAKRAEFQGGKCTADELRKVEEAPEGLVARKKKGEEEESYFVASKGKGKNKKNTSKTNGAASADAKDVAPKDSGALNIPFATLSALLSLSIPPPASSADVPRVIEDLNTKKAWFEANQARVTAENIAKAKAEIERLSKADPVSEVKPPNGSGENPAEPAPTPTIGPDSVAVPSEAVVDKLEAVEEDEEKKESESSS